MRIRLVHTFTLTLLLINRGEQIMSQNVEKNISRMLSSLGFENIRTHYHDDTLALSYESNIYRWNVRGWLTVIDSIINQVEPSTHLVVLSIQNGEPLFETRILASDWKRYRAGTISKKELKNKMEMTWLVKKEYEKLQTWPDTNSNLYKFDFLIYPQFRFQNIYLNSGRIYDFQVNLAPTVQFSLWKGNRFTGQVIIPLYNDIDFEGNYVHPGFITISQDFRIPGPFYTRLTAGLFNHNVYGIDFSMKHPFKNAHWNIGMDLGLTSFAYFFEDTLHLGNEFSFNYLFTAGYFFQPFNMEVDMTGGKFLFGDYGARIDISRYFGETAIGFYGLYAGGVINGGFHFTVPLPPGKRTRKHRVRIIPPRYFDFEYNAGSDYMKGQMYKSGPDENRSVNNYNLLYFKNSIY